MKKLLTLFYLSSFTIISSSTINSCMKGNSFIDQANEIYDMVNGKSILIRSDNIPLSANDNDTKNLILNKLGLNDKQKQFIKNLKGNLEVDKEVTISFEIKRTFESQQVYKTAEAKILINQINETKPQSQSDFKIANANNIALLPNKKQITLSNTSNASQVTDNNLSFDTPPSYELSDGTANPPLNVLFSNKYYYITTTNGLGEYLHYGLFSGLNENNEYTTFESSSYIYDIKYTKNMSFSNDKVYSISKKDASDKYGIFDVTNPNKSKIITNNIIFDNIDCNAVYDTGSKIYIATSKGMYVTTDKTTFNLVSNTDKYNINSVIVSPDGSKIFFGTNSNGLFFSNDAGKTFNQINSTASKSINYHSLFLSSNDNLYFGIKDEGLWKTDINGDNPAIQLISDHISNANNVKDISQYYDGTLLVLTNENLVYVQEF